MFPVRYVFFGFRVNVLLRQSKVYDVNDVLFLIALPANKEVFWLDISVDEVLRMHVLHSRYLQNNEAKVIREQTSYCAFLPNKAARFYQPITEPRLSAISDFSYSTRNATTDGVNQGSSYDRSWVASSDAELEEEFVILSSPRLPYCALPDFIPTEIAKAVSETLPLGHSSWKDARGTAAAFLY